MNPSRNLSRKDVQRFYDRFGSKQDSQAFYEDAALEIMMAHAHFETAQSVYEFGCGTGRFAEQLLQKALPATACYSGSDISQVMISLAEQRLRSYGARVSLAKSDGDIRIAAADHSIDRVVSTYVLDLLAEKDIKQFVSEAHRVLRPGGMLCLVSLTQGVTLASRLVAMLWKVLYTLRPMLVGGCRPVVLDGYFDKALWSVEYHHTIVRYGVPSEVVIASPIIHLVAA